MNILLWVLQVLLAVAFFAHGWMFLFPPASIAELINASLPRWFQLFLGVAEVLAAVGLTLPGLTRIQPWLVMRSCGVMFVMVNATVYHVSERNELGRHLCRAPRRGDLCRVHALAGLADRSPTSRVVVREASAPNTCIPRSNIPSA